MDKRVGLVQVETQRSRQARNGAEYAPHLHTHIVQHRLPIACVSGCVAQVPQLALEGRLLVRHRDNAGPGIATDGKVGRERREQLIVRGTGAKKLHVHEANLHTLSHTLRLLVVTPWNGDAACAPGHSSRYGLQSTRTAST